MPQDLLESIKDGVATLTLNRPDRLNALSVPMLDALVAGVLGAHAGRERTYTRGLKVAGRGESAVEEVLQPLYAAWRVASPPIDATICASGGRIDVYLATRAGDDATGDCVLSAAQEQAVQRPAPLQSEARFGAAAVSQAVQALQQRQPLRDASGATHAAGFADAQGRLLLVREDVGRHNALDKLVGALARQAVNAADGIVVVSSRASFEMVQKTAAAGVAVLASVSAPTALAIRLATDANVTLLGFLRDDDAAIYAHPERILT